MSLPGNQRKLEAADALAKLAEEAGITLIEMALAFVIRHPAVTAAIIGPRTMEQLESQLGAADVELSDDVLDKIDEIVPPGHQRQPGRRRLAEPGARAVRAAALGSRDRLRSEPVRRVRLRAVAVPANTSKTRPSFVTASCVVYSGSFKCDKELSGARFILYLVPRGGKSTC